MGTSQSGRYINTKGSGRSASDFAVIHSNEGTYVKTSGPNGNLRLKSGGHGQTGLNELDKYGIKYNIVKTYPNGVRVGNIPNHKDKRKRQGTNQAWFPSKWTSRDIKHAGEHVAGLKSNRHVPDGKVIWGTFKGVRTGVKRTNGKIAITLKEDDILLSAKKSNGQNEILIGSSNNRMIRFTESEIRVMGRTAAGVRGIDIGDGKCVGCEVTEPEKEILVVTENGYGKRTTVDSYRQTHRGSKGVKALNATEKNGNLVSFKVVEGNEDLMIITNSGMMIRLPIEQISQTGRVAQGVRLINLKDEQKVSTVAIVNKLEEGEDNVSRETSEA